MSGPFDRFFRCKCGVVCERELGSSAAACASCAATSHAAVTEQHREEMLASQTLVRCTECKGQFRAWYAGDYPLCDACNPWPKTGGAWGPRSNAGGFSPR